MTVLVCALALLPQVDEPVDYARDIQPILTEYCFACHGPDEGSRKGGLRLDVAADARASGAFDGAPSEIEYRVTTDDEFDVMPPPENGKSLSAKQIELLSRWVQEGAPYADHWAFRAPIKSAPPEVSNAAWARSPIDHFVLAKLDAAGLAPAPEADRRTLARRLSLDLRGLPPEPSEVEAFVQDASPDAYEQLVERWLEGPAWGEHRARHWLDVARYADTHGIHFDNYRDIWPYRDWVIDAFTRNVPFDQFTVEQLAGDLLPDPTIEQRVATGYLRCNITTNEGGLIDEEYKVLYARDRTETFGQTWLGLSVGCAVCHDHKYDPLTQAEFYSLSAYFDNTTVPVRDGNVADPGPILRVIPEASRARADELRAALAAAQSSMTARADGSATDLAAWLRSPRGDALLEPQSSADAELLLALTEGSGTATNAVVRQTSRSAAIGDSATWIDDGPAGPALRTRPSAVVLEDVGDFEGDQSFTSSAWVRIRADEPTGALWSRMDTADAYRGWDVWLQGQRVGAHVIHAFPQDWLKVVARDPLPADTWVHVCVTYDGSRTAKGVAVYYDGVPQRVSVEADKLKGSTRTTAPFRLATRTGGAATDPDLADLQIHRRTLSPSDVGAHAQRASARVARTAGLDALEQGARTSLRDWWLRTADDEWQTLDAQRAAHAQGLAAIEDASPTAHVFGELMQMPAAFVLNRGEYDQRRDEVAAGTPAFLPAIATDAPPSRLALARWLFDPEHPLTSRVAANRFWQEVFGTGLVATSDDFGLAGELPSHPELLDWLAIEFRERGWSVKELFRLIVTSSTYRQSARALPEALEIDPANRLLSRGPRFRMDAEMLRDTALSVSGLLVHQVGGPSVKPYQPPGVWEAVAMRESNTHDYRRDAGAKLWRRSLYTFWKRSAPPASMEIFDAPSRETCAIRRERTNTPLQALVTLNDPQFVEAARVLAANALASEEWAADRMDWMMQRLAARPLGDAERDVCMDVLADLIAHYREDDAAARALLGVGEQKSEGDVPSHVLAAWTMLANMLMNLDEVVTK